MYSYTVNQNFHHFGYFISLSSSDKTVAPPTSTTVGSVTPPILILCMWLWPLSHCHTIFTLAFDTLLLSKYLLYLLKHKKYQESWKERFCVIIRKKLNHVFLHASRFIFFFNKAFLLEGNKTFLTCIFLSDQQQSTVSISFSTSCCVISWSVSVCIKAVVFTL